MPRSAKGFVGTHQPKVRAILAKIDGTGTASVLSGKEEVTLTDTGTGDYLLTLKNKGKRIVSANFQPITAAIRMQCGTIVEGVSVQALAFGYNNTTATDADFFATIFVADDSRDF